MELKRKALVGGVEITSATAEEFAAQMVEDCFKARVEGQLPRIVISANGSVIAKYHSDPSFRHLVDAADLVDADGMPLVLASRLFTKNGLPERVATTDFIHVASEAAVASGISFYFLGGTEESNEAAVRFFQNKFPDLKVSGRRNGYFSRDDEPVICEEVRNTGTDVLWIGLGTPLQESFALRNREALSGVGWLRTCGGLLDYYSGISPRAPLWMQNVGLEWLFRASLEPRRLGYRYLKTNLPAAFHLLTKTK